MFESILEALYNFLGTREPLLVYSNIMSIIAIIAVILFYYFYIHIRGNVFFLQKTQGVYFQVGRIRVKKDTTQVSYKKSSYPIKASFFDGNKPNIYLDIENGKVLNFNEKDIGLSPKVLDVLLADNMLANIVRGLSSFMGINVLVIVLLGVFFAIGLMLGLFIYPYMPSPTGV